MGLDMYLTAKYYVKNWDHTEPERRTEITITQGGKKSKIPTERIQTVEVDVAYWRKANAIHRWFVEHAQGGVDECQEAYVGKELLEELLETVKEVLGEPETAPQKLPTQSGFFFGGTEYDEYYFEDLKQTQTQLEAALKMPTTFEDGFEGFYYHSSW